MLSELFKDSFLQAHHSPTQKAHPSSIFGPDIIDLTHDEAPVVGWGHHKDPEPEESAAPVTHIYQEKTNAELIGLMEAWPLEEGLWSDEDDNLDIIVLPLSLAQFWDAFLADDAPYYYLAMESELHYPTTCLDNGDWGAPSDGADEFFGTSVVSERMYDRRRRLKHNAFATFIHENIYLSLVEHSDTHIVLKETTVYPDLRAYQGFEQWIKWDVLTDDPRSNQTVLRQSHMIQWYDKPWGFGRLIQWEVMTDLREDNAEWPVFFEEAAELFVQGPPYENALQDPEAKAEARIAEAEAIEAAIEAAEEERRRAEEAAAEAAAALEPETDQVDRPDIVVPDVDPTTDVVMPVIIVTPDEHHAENETSEEANIQDSTSFEIPTFLPESDSSIPEGEDIF